MPLILTKTINTNPYVQRPVEQRFNLEWDPRGGFQTIRRWIGTKARCLALLPGLQANGWAFRMTEEGGQNYQVVATIGASFTGGALLDDPVDVWESTTATVETPLLQSNNPLVTGLTPAAGNSPGDMAVIQSLLNNPPGKPPTQGTPALAVLDGQGNTTTAAVLSANGLKVYYLMLAGVTSDPVFAPTIRRTATVSNLYAVAAAQTGVGLLYLSATLAALLPAGVIVTLPADGSIVNGNGMAFNYGWLKDGPNVTASAFNKTQIIQDWKFGLWSQDLKGAPI